MLVLIFFFINHDTILLHPSFAHAKRLHAGRVNVPVAQGNAFTWSALGSLYFPEPYERQKPCQLNVIVKIRFREKLCSQLFTLASSFH